MFEKIKACYDYECVWNEWDSPHFYKKHKSDDNAFILGERMENNGVKFVKYELHGRNDAIDEVMKLQAKVTALEGELEKKMKALKEIVKWATFYGKESPSDLLEIAEQALRESEFNYEGKGDGT